MCDITELIDEYHERAGITKLEVSQRMGIEYSTYKRKTNQHDQYEITVRELPAFIRAHNMDYKLLDVIELIVGRVAIPISKTNEPITMKTAAKIAEQQGKALSSLITALDDNILTADEKKDLRDQYCKLAQLINTALQALNK